MTGNRVNAASLSLFGFLIVLAVTWFCYRPALSGVFQLDDVSNLAGLARIEDADSASNFVLSGSAGVTGRPLALLTFALQADEWEQGASAFLRVNVLIHLLNALVLAACLYYLGLLQAIERQKAIVVAMAAASMWAVMPLLASASLLVVQRMTTLCALFTLLGLGGYLFARRKIEQAPGKALIAMSASLAAGTLLATLCKESGLLLPSFALVLEATVLRRPAAIQRRLWRYWHALFLVLPTVAIVAYLSTRAVYPDWLVARRDFNGWERLLTETRVLWIYLQKALLGVPAQLGIYQTAPAISRSLFEPLTFIASAAWILFALLSIIWRRKYPLLALAVLWYLAGHMIESSVVSLELYFEHRNYVPIIGAVFALSAFLFSSSQRRMQIGAAAVTAHIAVSAFFLFGFASLSGEPSLASRYWALQYPESVRAVTRMATYQLAEEGPERALQTLDGFVTSQPQFAYLRIQELNLRCLFAGGADHRSTIAQLHRQLPGADFTYSAGTMLSQLFSTASRTTCNGVDTGTVMTLAGALHGNPRYANNPVYNQFHYKLLAGISRNIGEYEATIENLAKAIEYRPSSELNMMMVTALGGAGNYTAANEFLDAAETMAPLNPLRAIAWQRDLDDLRGYIGALQENVPAN